MPLWNGAPLLNLVYPVGSIYLSSKNTNPGTLFGGTWTQIKDKFILTAGDSYSNGATGGAATVTLSVSNMPSHKHSFTPSGTVGSHKHSFTPSGTVSSHSHSFTPSGTVSSSFSGTAGTTGQMSQNAEHRHVTTDDSNSTLERYDPNESKEDISASGKAGGGYHYWTWSTNTDHTHSFTPSGTVSSSFSGTAGYTGETAPSFSGTAGYTGETAPSFSGTAGYTDSNGSGSSFSILPPYVVKYCWERMA